MQAAAKMSARPRGGAVSAAIPTRRAPAILPRPAVAPSRMASSRGFALVQAPRRSLVLRASAEQQQEPPAMPPISPAADPGMVKVRFSLPSKVKFGVGHKVVGSCEGLGDWEVDEAPEMKWTEGHVWEAEIAVPAGIDVKFKYCRVHEGADVEWEEHEDHNLEIPPTATAVIVGSTWGNPEWDYISVVDPTSDGTRGQGGPPKEPPPSDPRAAGVTPSASPGAHGWIGGRPSSYQPAPHDPSGVGGAARALVEGDASSKSWSQKLDIVKGLVALRGQRADPDTLAHVSTYLRWVSSGAVMCDPEAKCRAEDVAAASREVFECVERMVGNSSDEIEIQVLRRILRKLPATRWEAGGEGTPLDRLRGVADRVPDALASEVQGLLKSLENSAAPYDRVSAERLLAKSQACQEYAEGGECPPPDVADELESFVDEIRSFHGTAGLVTEVSALIPSFDEAQETVLRNFLTSKNKLDALAEDKGSYGIEATTSTLHSLTHLRAIVCHGLDSGLRNDCDAKSLSMRQRWRRAEIELERYATVLLGHVVAATASLGGEDGLAGVEEPEWLGPMQALVLGVRNLGLSAWDAPECMAVEHEIVSWQTMGGFASDPTSALRLQSTLHRLIRLADDFGLAIDAAFVDRSKALGAGLGVAPSVVAMAGAEKGQTLAYHLSLLAAQMADAAGVVAGADPTIDFDEVPVPVVGGGGSSGPEGTVAAPIVEMVMTDGLTVVPGDQATTSMCGSKAESCNILTQIGHMAMQGGTATSGTPAGFVTPRFVCIPFGGMERAMDVAGQFDRYEDLLGQVQLAEEGPALDEACQQIQDLCRSLRAPPELIQQVCANFPPRSLLIVRPSASVEDLSRPAGNGLHEAVPGVAAGDPIGLGAAVAEVWASLYTRRAVLARRQAGVAQDSARMGVIVQELLASEYSFSVRSRGRLPSDPKDQPSPLRAAVAVGNGGALALAHEGGGSPWRLAVNKDTGDVRTEAFANMSGALVVGVPEGEVQGSKPSLIPKLVDYSKEGLTVDPDQREAFGRRIGAIGKLLEREFGTGVDIEGALVDGQIQIVQARPQP